MENTCETNPRPKTFKELIRSAWFLRPFLGVLIGAIGGFLYYHYVGCSSGTCAITSRWHTMLLFGGIIGYLIGDSIKLKTPEKITEEKKYQ